MNFRKDYTILIALYAFAILYVALVGDKTVTIIFIMGLFFVTIIIASNIRNTVSKDKKESVISLQNKLEKSKKESEETYKRFLSLSTTLGSGVLMVNDEGKITFSNKDVENYFGIDFNNRDYNDLIEIKRLYNFINKAYLLEEHVRKQIKYEEKYFDLISTPLFEDDMFAGCLILVHDITLVKTAEKFQKQFTADVSHELRTPLSAIKGFSEIILRDENMTEENRLEFMGLINQESERMEIILNDLMVISRLDRLDYELDLKKLNIKQVIQESIGVLEQKFKEKDLKKEVILEDCVFEFDKVKIAQVILNIVKNAINYSDCGFVNVKGYVQDRNYIIKISDSGIGINETNITNIFKRFFRVDKARSRDTGGSGLGLSISKNAIIKHGGTIDVISEENIGSTFIITLPIDN